MQFDPQWRFASPGPMPQDAVEAFYSLVMQISAQGEAKSILERFKQSFATAAGIVYYGSTNERFAREDSRSYMLNAAPNAPLFLEAFWQASMRAIGDAGGDCRS